MTVLSMAARKKQWYLSRMMWINILGATASVIVLVQQFLVTGDFSEIAFLGLAYAVINLVLRKLTKTEIK